MKRAANHLIITTKALLMLVTSAWLALPSHAQASIFAPFTRVQIEGPYIYAPPWGKALGDIDGDGYPDIAAGFGGSGRQVFWYQYPTWSKHRISTHDGGEDIQLVDVNNDGSLDVVTATSDTLDGVAWYENPRGHGGNPATDTWTRHIIENPVNFYCGHDVLAGDLDGDGKVDVVIRVEHGPTLVYLQVGPDSWTKIQLSNASPGEGSALLDVNRDGKLDIVENGYWLEQPADPARGNWVRHDFAAWSEESGVMVGDINKDGRPDVVLSPEEFNNGRISWFEQPADPIHGTWVEHVILAPANYVHRVRIGDFNKDGTIDVAFAEMSNSTTRRVGILYNNDGAGTSWSLQVLATTAGQNIAIDDVDGDGDLDIVNADWGNNGILELYRNNINNSLSLDSWQYKQIDAARSTASFGLNFGDIDSDGRIDVVSGPYWYRNPGGDLSGSWTRFDLPSGMDGMLVLDIDHDGQLDVIAEGRISGSSQLGVYWLKNNGQGASWTTVLVANITPDTDSFESRGYVLGQILPGGFPEIVLTSGSAGAYYLQVPTNPAQGNWPSVLISEDVMPGGIAVADINRDGKPDLVGTVGPAGTTVSWWENPGTRTANWLRHDVGTTSGIRGDRVAAADINRDGRLDIVVSEANLAASGNSLFWFAQPSNPAIEVWIRGAVATGQGSLNSMDVADVNLDGKPDIITGEYRGNLYVSVWENVNKGASFTQHIVSSGRASYLGARVVDLDRDGAQDVVSIALDTYPLLHLWRNNAIVPDTIVPLVSITTPRDGDTLSGTITVTASASDNVGVAGVQFRLDGINLGPEATAAPYSIRWDTTTAPNGMHKLTAVAGDFAGNVVPSTDVTLTLNNVNPPPPSTIAFVQGSSITSDTSSATVAQAFTTSTAAGNLIVAVISWGSNAGVSCSDSQGNAYSIATTQYDGRNNQALAICYAANVKGGADTITATLSSAAPFQRLLIHEYRGIALTAPLDVVATNLGDGSTASDAITSTSATTTASGDLVFGAVLDDAGVNAIEAGTNFTPRMSVNSADLASEDRLQGPPGSVAATWTFSAPHRYFAQVIAFKPASSVDNIPPTAGITAPGNGAMLTGTITVSATASDDVSVVGVQFQLDGTNLGAELTAAPYSAPWDTTTTANGSHVLTAIARDAAGNRTTSGGVTVTVDNVAPAVSVTGPANNAFVAGTITVSATASDNVGVVGVQFQLDGANLGAELTSAPYSASWSTTTATNAPHTLTAIARDAAGNRTTSGGVTVTVDNVAPAVSVTGPANNAFVLGTITVAATASDNVGIVGVQFQLDGANLGAELTSAPYSVSWNTTTATNAPHNLTAIARDAAGNRTTSGGVTVTVDNVAPAVSVTGPANGAFVTGTVIVSATASDNLAVAGVQFQLDGANLGTEVTGSPYSVPWNTRGTTNGPHTLTAIARDATGNRTTSSIVAVTVSNIIFVQGGAVSDNTSSETIAQGFTSATAPGDLIVAAISWDNSSSVSCSDSQGNAYTVATTQYDSFNRQSLAICYAPNIQGGTVTVTATFSASASYRRLLIHEYHGIALTEAVDVVANNMEDGSTTSDAITSTAATTTVSGDLVFGAVMDDSGVNNISAGTGFTLRQSVNSTDLASEDLVQTSSESVAATFTFSAAHRYLAQMVTFKHAP